MTKSVVHHLAEALARSKSAVVFTGAGMSTESGLPDFRSSTGLWGRYRPEELASTDALNRNFEEFAAFYRKRIEALDGVQPNSGHRILADWEKRGLLKGIITQNVDGLHQAAGSRSVHELHGTLREVRCQDCGASFPAATYRSTVRCPSCSGKLRAGVVLFGEMLPEKAFASAVALASKSDLFIVLGSSLLVSPANMLPQRAKQGGAAFYIVNATETPLDFLADGVYHGSIGEALAQIDALLSQEPKRGIPGAENER